MFQKARCAAKARLQGVSFGWTLGYRAKPSVLKLRAELVRWVLSGLLVGMLPTGCGSAPPNASAPEASTPAPSAEPALPPTLNLTELESLEHDLQQSEARLDAELARKLEPAAPLPTSEPESLDEPKPADPAGSGAAAPASGPRAEPQQRPSSPTPDRAVPPGTDDRGSSCDLGCRAFASMRRAQARICEIAGAGPRCQAAIERVQAAAQRVTRAGCECLPSENR